MNIRGRLDRSELRTHEKKILCGLVDFYADYGHTEPLLRDPTTGGIYEHKLARRLGYELDSTGSPAFFLETCRLLEEQGFVVRMVRSETTKEKGIWPTFKGIEQAEYWNATPLKKIRLFFNRQSVTIITSAVTSLITLVLGTIFIRLGLK